MRRSIRWESATTVSAAAVCCEPSRPGRGKATKNPDKNSLNSPRSVAKFRVPVFGAISKWPKDVDCKSILPRSSLVRLQLAPPLKTPAATPGFFFSQPPAAQALTDCPTIGPTREKTNAAVCVDPPEPRQGSLALVHESRPAGKVGPTPVERRSPGSSPAPERASPPQKSPGLPAGAAMIAGQA